jgi:aspartate/tyrosine/aromatic aminotransferase
MFEQLAPAPPDAILGLTEAFKRDPNPNKINLGVGIYKDEQGRTPVLRSVKRAEEQILAAEQTKNYLAIDGSPAFNAATQVLLFGRDHEIVTGKRAVTVQAPGGTGALRVAADFIARTSSQTDSKKTVWISEPTWPNHPSVFKSAGLGVATYPYFDPSTNGIDFGAMMATLREIPQGDVLLVHACCHNPTGSDLSPEQWRAVAAVVEERGLLPLLDFAYQGFADGIDADAAGLKEFARPGAELLACSSFSKNFSLYRERVGALFGLASTAAAAASVQSQFDKVIRSNYSNPPGHGAEIVATILRDAALRKQWEGELTAMRTRINGMRKALVAALKKEGVPGDYSFIQRQRGMFSFSGLTKEQVAALQADHAIYAVGSGRINVAGLTPSNIDRVAECIGADVGQPV